MFGIERLQAIRELLLEKKSVEVTYLSKELGVSEVTIRRDLDKLEKEGLVAKTYGGAILIEEGGALTLGLMDAGASPHMEEISEELGGVARTATKLIDNGDTVFIGGGPIGMALARHLVEKEDLIVVTNNLEVAMTLYKSSDFKLILLGGEVDPATGDVLEYDQLDELLIEKSFIFVEGIDEQFGYTVNEKNHVRLYKKLKSVTRNMIVVAMKDAFEKRGLVKMAPLYEVENIVTEKSMPDHFKTFYYENNITVHTTMLSL